jgi:glycosyltransferase involved in cell wall biosynthesis
MKFQMDRGAVRRLVFLEVAQNVWPEVVSGMPTIYLTRKELIRRGHQVHYTIPDDGKAYQQHEGVNIHRFWMPFYYDRPESFGEGAGFFIAKMQYLLFHILGVLKLTRLAKKLKPDVIYSHGPYGIPIGSFVAKLRGIPNISRTYGHVYAATYTRFQQLLNFELPYSLKYPAALYIIGDDGTKVVTLSEKWGVPSDKAHYLVDGHDKEKYNPDFDVVSFKKQIGLPPDSKILLSVCSLTKLKRTEYVIKSLPKILEKHPDVYHVIVGDGPEMGNLERLAESLGVGSRVKFMGRVAHSEVQKFFNIADIVAAIWSIGPLFEGMLSEKCVVTLNLGETDRFVKNMETGVIVEYSDLDDLERILIPLLDNSEQRDRIGNAARSWAIENLDTIEGRISKEVDLIEKTVEDWPTR